MVVEDGGDLAGDFACGEVALNPSMAVRQNWQLTAQPTWLETQMVARWRWAGGWEDPAA